MSTAFSVAHVSNLLLMRPPEPWTESGPDYPFHPLLPWVAFTAANTADELDVLLLSLTDHVTDPSSDHSSETSSDHLSDHLLDCTSHVLHSLTAFAVAYLLDVLSTCLLDHSWDHW